MLYTIVFVVVFFVVGVIYGRYSKMEHIRKKVVRKVFHNRKNPNVNVRTEPTYLKGFEDGMIWTVEEMYGYPLEWVDQRGDIRGR